MIATTYFLQFSISVIDEILANITSTNIMSTLDLTSGNFQIAMQSEDIAKTAFITSNGCFVFTHMNFGLSGISSSTFQKANNTIRKPLLGKGVLF